MSYFKNFKSVTYCVAQWADHISESELRKQADWLQKYIGIDKVYLETYRDNFARKEQILMIKKVLEEYGIEVSGGITTVTPDVSDEDKKRHRLFSTFCYCNEPMRKKLKEISEYTAQFFDEFIIDDFFFTQCMCENCIREKGNKSWAEFRLAKMMEVSENLIIKPAKAINPKINIIIKYPNWRESFQETGYNPGEQRNIFDMVYTGTETRHGAQQDQHLPRYLSYSLPRWVENAAPGRNGGGWFDPYDCDRIDTYLEQAYLTVFSKCKELMMFCWPSIYDNKRATPLGYQYQKLDEIIGECGNPVGLKTYIPFNSQGDDHIEDYLGMIGIPIEPSPDFPSVNNGSNLESVLVTAASLTDEKIIDKIKEYSFAGGKVIATSGFMLGAFEKKLPIEDITSIRYTGRRLDADEFQVTTTNDYGRNYVNSNDVISFPLLEHRNNASWSKVNAGHGEYHESIVMYETYGEGVFEVINLPDMPSRIRDLPDEVLTVLRYELISNGKVWIDAPYGVSVFTYDNDIFGIYCYTNDGCAPVDFNIHIKGECKKLDIVPEPKERFLWKPFEFKPLYSKPVSMFSKEFETVFHTRINPGDFQFFKIKQV